MSRRLAPDHFRIKLARFTDTERAWSDPGEPAAGEGETVEMIVYASTCPVRKVMRPWNAKNDLGNTLYLTPPERDRAAALVQAQVDGPAGPLFGAP